MELAFSCQRLLSGICSQPVRAAHPRLGGNRQHISGVKPGTQSSQCSTFYFINVTALCYILRGNKVVSIERARFAHSRVAAGP